MEKHENQIVYRDVLHEQERFKQNHPERALKVTESPGKYENTRVPSSQYSSVKYAPPETLKKSSNVVPRQVEPIGPVDANIGHKSNYRGPNPILTPVSDPLYNPYVRREVTNSLYDPKKKSIYVPPNSYAY